MKIKRKCFTRVLLVLLLVVLLTLAIFPDTTNEAEKAGKQEKKSTSFFKRVGKGIGALFKPSNFRLELNTGWSAWGVGDFKRANEFIENTYQGSATHTAETQGFGGSVLGGLKLFAEYRLANSRKLGLGTGFRFLPGGSFEQVVNSATESITRSYDISSFAIPLEVSYKMPLKMKIFKKPLLLRFGAGFDFISSTIDYVFDRSVTAANGGLKNLSRTTNNGSEHTVIKLKDSALGGHISVGLEYPFAKNFGLTLDAGYSFGSLDKFTGTYIDQHGEQRDVVLGTYSEYDGYIIPFVYHDTICPSLNTAGINPGGPGISIGITYYPGKPKEPGYEIPEEIPPPPEEGKQGCKCKNDGCIWSGGPGISIKKNLAYFPKTTQMKAGQTIAFSTLASDADMFMHKCTELGKTKGKIYTIASPVQYRWGCKGIGKLLHISGSTVLYRLPTDMARESSKDCEITCTISSPRDGSIAGKARLRIKRNNDKCRDAAAPLEVSVELQPIKEGQGSGLTPPAGTCDPGLETDSSPGIQAVLQVPSEGCRGEMTLLKASCSDSDKYILSCSSGAGCENPAKKTEDVPDLLCCVWSDTGAGGRFPLGNEGPSVAYIPPEKGDEVLLQCSVSDRNVPDGGKKLKGKMKLQKLDLILENVPEKEEECPGGFVFLEDDEQKKSKDEDNLVKVTVEKDPKQGKVTLKAAAGSGKIKLWETREKKREVKLPKTIDGTDLPKDFWIEGVKVSNKVGDIQLVLESKDSKCRDIVNLTVYKAKLLGIGFSDAGDKYGGDNEHPIHENGTDPGQWGDGSEIKDPVWLPDGDDADSKPDRNEPACFTRSILKEEYDIKAGQIDSHLKVDLTVKVEPKGLDFRIEGYEEAKLSFKGEIKASTGKDQQIPIIAEKPLPYTIEKLDKSFQWQVILTDPTPEMKRELDTSTHRIYVIFDRPVLRIERHDNKLTPKRLDFCTGWTTKHRHKFSICQSTVSNIRYNTGNGYAAYPMRESPRWLVFNRAAKPNLDCHHRALLAVHAIGILGIKGHVHRVYATCHPVPQHPRHPNEQNPGVNDYVSGYGGDKTKQRIKDGNEEELVFQGNNFEGCLRVEFEHEGLDDGNTWWTVWGGAGTQGAGIDAQNYKTAKDLLIKYSSIYPQRWEPSYESVAVPTKQLKDKPDNLK